MAKLRSLDDLLRVRDEVKRSIKTTLDTGTAIFVGTGTCGTAAGARETVQAIEKELAQRKIQATVSTVGCIGMCAKEPLVDIQQAGKSHVLYANILPDMVPRLIESHLVKGEPVKEWVICRMPSE
jgi:NADP-reducing hydrogenase subunit HndB